MVARSRGRRAVRRVATCHDAIWGAQPGEHPVDGREAQPLGGDVAAQLGEDDHQAALRGESKREQHSASAGQFEWINTFVEGNANVVY